MFNFLEKTENQKIWVVRSEQGRLFNDFIETGIVGVQHGHAELESFFQNRDPLIDFLFQDQCLFRESLKNLNRSALGQLCNFIFVMNLNDIVITLNLEKVVFGVLVGEPFFSSGMSSNNSLLDKFKTRRKVEWIREVKRKELPRVLESVLRAHQAVFDITNYSTYVRHVLENVFYDGNNVYHGTFVTKDQDIDAINICKYINYNKGIKGVFGELSKDTDLLNLLKLSLSEDSIFSRDSFYSFLCSDAANPSFKGEIYSPGPLWFKFPFFNDLRFDLRKLTFFSAMILAVFSFYTYKDDFSVKDFSLNLTVEHVKKARLELSIDYENTNDIQEKNLDEKALVYLKKLSHVYEDNELDEVSKDLRIKKRLGKNVSK